MWICKTLCLPFLTQKNEITSSVAFVCVLVCDIVAPGFKAAFLYEDYFNRAFMRFSLNGHSPQPINTISDIYPAVKNHNRQWAQMGHAYRGPELY